MDIVKLTNQVLHIEVLYSYIIPSGEVQNIIIPLRLKLCQLRLHGQVTKYRPKHCL